MFVTASLFVLAFFQVFVANASHSEYPAKRHVLLINSYHQGFKWTDDVVRAVNDVFATTAHPIELYVEYMDTKRVFNSRYLESFQKTIADKYKSVKLDTVLVSDNNAFSLMLQYRDEIFPGVPVVFSGVNNFHESMIEGRPDFIGVPEIFDAHGTIEAALKTQIGRAHV